MLIGPQDQADEIDVKLVSGTKSEESFMPFTRHDLCKMVHAYSPIIHD
jgi:hypothetical protein